MQTRLVIVSLLILAACKKDREPSGELDFTITQLSEGKYEFTAISDFARDYYWEFGDSSIADYRKSATHRYARPGTYTIILTAFGADKIKSKKREMVVGPTTSPTEIFIKGLSIDSGYFDYWDTDGTAADIYYEVLKDGIKIHKSYVYKNLVRNEIPVVFYEYAPVKLYTWNAVYTVFIYDDNGPFPAEEIYRFTFYPEAFKSGLKPYPSHLFYKSDKLKGNLFFEYDNP